MNSWPLLVQWVVLVLVGGAFLGSSWWLELRRARAAGVEPAAWSEKARVVVRSFGIGDWAVIALLVMFLITLVIRTVAGS